MGIGGSGQRRWAILIRDCHWKESDFFVSRVRAITGRSPRARINAGLVKITLPPPLSTFDRQTHVPPTSPRSRNKGRLVSSKSKGGPPARRDRQAAIQ